MSLMPYKYSFLAEQVHVGTLIAKLPHFFSLPTLEAWSPESGSQSLKKPLVIRQLQSYPIQ